MQIEMNKELPDTIKKGLIVRLDALPDELQERIKQYAIFDILKDKAKADIQANQVNIDQYLKDWLKSKSEQTKKTYQRAVIDFLSWFNRHYKVHPLLVKSEHVDRYIDYLRDRLKNNSIRLKISALASFYSMLHRYEHILINPFHYAALPRREYKKAIKTDQNKTIPVMNDKEYEAIIEAIKKEICRKEKHIAAKNARNAAKRLLPAVQMMAKYGLRVGAIPTLERRNNDYFTYTTKGGKSFTINIEKNETLPSGKTPFRGYKVITIQKAFKRITERLRSSGIIRYAYSCHDLRHYFASCFYQKTKDIVQLKQMLGHASLNVTDVYIQALCIK